MKKSLLVILFLFTLTACTSIPISSLYKLSKLDIKTINPKAVKVALQLPSYLKVGQVNLKLSHTPEGTKEKPIEFILEKTKNLEDYKKYEQKGYSIVSFGLTDVDSKKLNKFRKKILLNRPHRKTNDKTKIVIQYKGLCKVSNSDNKPPLISIYLKTTNTSGFFPFIEKMDIQAKAKEKGYIFDGKDIKSCSSSTSISK